MGLDVEWELRKAYDGLGGADERFLMINDTPTVLLRCIDRAYRERGSRHKPNSFIHDELSQTLWCQAIKLDNDQVTVLNKCTRPFTTLSTHLSHNHPLYIQGRSVWLLVDR